MIVKQILDLGGNLNQLKLPLPFGAIFNPSVWVDNNTILVNIRHAWWKGENQTTTNFFGELNEDLTIKFVNPVNTTVLDTKPQWEYRGLEDGRVIKWDNKIYLCGVRRDTKLDGEGRMELSEINYTTSYAKEISRWSIPVPDEYTYCEKNWMPVVNNPYHFWRWTDPIQIVKVDPSAKTCNIVLQGKDKHFSKELRGSGYVIPFEEGYLSLTHEVDFLPHRKYTHRFIKWSKDHLIISQSDAFTFLDKNIEFACSMVEFNDCILITFGIENNSAYVLKFPKSLIKTIIKP